MDTTAINMFALNWESLNWLSQLVLVIFAGIALITGTVVNKRQAKELLELKTKLLETGEKASKAQESASKAEIESDKLKIVVAGAEEKRAKAEQALLELQQRLAPRVITPTQEAIILDKLKDALKDALMVHICFEVDTGADDALAFTNSIGRVLEKAGYDPLPMARPMGGDVSRDITVSPEGDPEAQKLVDAFLAAGLRATNIRSGGHMYFPGYTQVEPPGTLTVTIGKRSAE